MADFTREELEVRKAQMRILSMEMYDKANKRRAAGDIKNAHFYDGRRVGLFDAINMIDELLNGPYPEN